VEFLEEPTEQPYGIDCGVRDPFGNQGRITEPAPEIAEITDEVKERWTRSQLGSSSSTSWGSATEAEPCRVASSATAIGYADISRLAFLGPYFRTV
jgi:hypothetical protein